MILNFKKLLKNTTWIWNQSKSSIHSLLIIIFVGVISSLTTILIALTTKKLFDSAQYGKIDTLLQSGLVIIGIVFLQTVMQSALSIYSTKVSVTLSNKFRYKLFEKLYKTQWQYFTEHHSGDLMTHMTSDIEEVAGGVTSVIPGMVSLVFSLIASMIVLYIFDPLLALLAFLLGPAAIIFMRFFSRRLKEYYLRIQEMESTFRSFIQERLENMHIVKTFRLESESGKIIKGLQKKQLDIILKRSRLGAFSSAILSLGYWVGYLLAILWGTVRLSQGTATFGTITVFLQLVGQIQGPFVSLAYSIPQLIVMNASAERLMKLYDMKEENFTEDKLQWKTAGISVENLEFEYNPNSSVINKANFHIHPGEFVAIVGASGEGKTTFIRLLLSLLKPSKGDIYYINPETQEKVIADVITRSLASYVPQGNTLFSGMISDNVLLGNNAASKDELIEALKNACIWDFIDSLPEKLETKIGENGYGLSEGQAQRISIARALISKKPVLILDEATSALDSDTELEVLKSIASIKPLPTCIIITHRKAALDYCNRILVIENGTIREA